MQNYLPFSGVIIAGGDSKRMGERKALLKLGSQSLVEIIFNKLKKLFAEVIIVSDINSELAHLQGAVLAEDIYKEGGKSPLRGIQAALAVSTQPASFVIACDMPFFSLSLIEYMSKFADDNDVVVPQIEGYYQPLFAFYHSRLFDFITKALSEKRYKINELYSQLKVKEIEENAIKSFDPFLFSFYNINTKEAYEKAKEYVEGTKDVDFI